MSKVCMLCGAALGSDTFPICAFCRGEKVRDGPKVRHEMHEAREQEALFEWAGMMSGRHPELELMFHIPNGGKRNKYEAANLKRQGVKAGVPDICLPVSREGYHGLYIELKYGKNTKTENQSKWALRLSEQGYKCITAYGWQAASEEITKYLEGRK